MLFKHYPSYWLGAVRTILTLLIAFHVLALSPEQTGAVLGVVSAVIAVAIALAVRPFSWPLITGLAQAGVAVLLAFGLKLHQDQIAGILAVVSVAVSYLDHTNVVPETKLPALVAAKPAV